MSETVSVLFFLLWAVVGFVVAYSVFRRFPKTLEKPWLPAVAIVFAFFAGFNWPSAPRNDVVAISGPPSASVAAKPTAVINSAAVSDVSLDCNSRTTVPVESETGFLDQIKSGTVILSNPGSAASGARLTLSGWAVDIARKQRVAAVCPIVDGSVFHGAQVLYGAPRPDVALNLGVPDLVNVGYSIILPTGSLRPGPHHVGAFSVLNSGIVGVLSGTWNVSVR